MLKLPSILFSSFAKMSFRFCFDNLVISVLFMALSLQTTLGESTERSTIKCEALDETNCAFAVSWSGKRCVLERKVKRSGEEAVACRTSEIKADRLQNIVETEQCVEGCGLNRNTLGTSYDSLLDTRKLCSSHCYNHCPNVVDLFNHAAGLGVFPSKFCEAQRKNVRREMSGTKSSGIVTPITIQPVAPSIMHIVMIDPVQPISLSNAPRFASMPNAPKFAPILGAPRFSIMPTPPAFAPVSMSIAPTFTSMSAAPMWASITPINAQS